MTVEYDGNSIISLSDIMHIRTRVSAYLPDSGIAGQMHAIRELIDNSIDEIALQQGTGVMNVVLFRDLEHDIYQVAVIDNGRGIPYEKLIDVFATTKTSGKFNTSNYKYSAGSFGVGASVSCALANWFRAITLNRNIIGDVTIRYDNVPTNIQTLDNTTGATGSVVIYEPDKSVFSEISEAMLGYERLTEYLIQLSLFGEFRLRMFVIDSGIDKKLRTAPTGTVLTFLENIINTHTPEFDGATLDKDSYINKFFSIPKAWSGKYEFSGMDTEDTLRVVTKLLVAPNVIPTGNTNLTFVNNILFTDKSSLHISMLKQAIKDKMGPLIADKSVRTFFINDYKLPIWLVMDVKFSSAQFTGFSKVSFRDLAFKYPYSKLLDQVLVPELLAEIYGLIADNVVVMFNRANNTVLKTQDLRHLGSALSRPSKFNNCSTTNRAEAELFLIEGDSAKSDQDRDSSFQASYTLGGKPANTLTEIGKLNESVNMIRKNLIFQDIIKILNITPGATDLSNMNFGKIFIMADADTHGYHISNILIGNLFALCPALIEQGRLYLVKAPLYSIRVKDSEPIYVRNETELQATLSYFVYSKCLEIELVTDHTRHVLSDEEFVAFSEIVIRIADELKRVSQEYMIPALLFEQLSLLTSHLRLAVPDVAKLKECLGYDVRYVPSSHLLVISVGIDDVVVPLTQITDIIYQRILPLYREFFYGKVRILATTKNSNLYNKAQMSIVMLNMVFESMSSIFTFKRFKGLGGMPSADRARTCINPKTRRVYQITSLGDLDRIFDMMGTDPTKRKELLAYQG